MMIASISPSVMWTFFSMNSSSNTKVLSRTSALSFRQLPDVSMSSNDSIPSGSSSGRFCARHCAIVDFPEPFSPNINPRRFFVGFWNSCNSVLSAPNTRPWILIDANCDSGMWNSLVSIGAICLRFVGKLLVRFPPRKRCAKNKPAVSLHSAGTTLWQLRR